MVRAARNLGAVGEPAQPGDAAIRRRRDGSFDVETEHGTVQRRARRERGRLLRPAGVADGRDRHSHRQRAAHLPGDRDGAGVRRARLGSCRWCATTTCRAIVRQEQQSGLIGIYEQTGAESVWGDGDGEAPDWSLENPLFDYRLRPGGACGWDGRSSGCRCWSRSASSRRSAARSPTRPTASRCWARRVWRTSGRWSACRSASPTAPAWDASWPAGWCTAPPRVSGAGFRRPPLRLHRPCRHRPPTAASRAQRTTSTATRTPLPGLERPAGAPVPHHTRCTSACAGKGAVFTQVHGWERPKWFPADGGAAGGQDMVSFRHTGWFDTVAAGVPRRCASGWRSSTPPRSRSSTLVGPDAAAVLDRAVHQHRARAGPGGAHVPAHAAGPHRERADGDPPRRRPPVLGVGRCR